MTPSEERIMQLIQSNPYITQQEIADALGIARSSVAVHISHMMTKGDILGRGYLLPESENQPNSRYAVVIGGANVDIVGRPSLALVASDSNPGRIYISPGGVARNIASNLSKMKVLTELIVPIGGEDERSDVIQSNLNRYLSLSHSIRFPDEGTGTYLVLLDETGEMSSAVNDMTIMDRMTKEVIEKKKAVISSAEVIVLDTNLPEETLEYVLKNMTNYKIVDTVSTAKAVRIKRFLEHINLLKCNKFEAEAISGRKIKNRSDLIEVGLYLTGKGLETLVLSNGEDGAYLFHENEIYRFWGTHIDVKNSTGAGDAFTALLTYGRIRKLPKIESLINATAASRLTLKSIITESEEINEELLKIEREEVHYEQLQ